MNYIGIDPGKNGCIAWTDGVTMRFEKMPDTIQGVWNVFRGIAMEGSCIAGLESVSSSPGMGVVSAFTFGNGFGHLEMALTGWEIPFIRIRPQKWQQYMGCLTKGDKNVSKARAQELFPLIKIIHSNADAILIAEYCRQTQRNK